MRIILDKGRQRELIEKAKQGFTWGDLAKKLNLNQNYLMTELRNERRTLSEKNYKTLCSLAKTNFDKYISEKLKDNWGKSKGGINSPGSLKKIPKIKLDEKLAEFLGAVLGDGNICFYQRGNSVGVYGIKIAGDFIKDKDYHLNYLKRLSKNIFNLEAKEVIPKDKHERFLSLNSRALVEFFNSMGLRAGDKIKNQSTIPSWIFNEHSYIRACLRGLIDTDGSVFRMSKRDFNLIRINFCNHNITLLKDTREAFIKLGFHPSKIINNRQFYLSRQSEVGRYLKEIGFSNKKHLDRIKLFNSPVF